MGGTVRQTKPPALGVLGTLVLVAVSGCAAPSLEGGDAPAATASFTEETGGVQGFVTNDEIVPLAGVNVTLQGVASTLTDAAGRFAFSQVKPGRYELSAVAFAYQTMSKQIDVMTGSVAEVRFALASVRLDEGFVRRSVEHGNLSLGTPMAVVFTTGLVEGVDKATFTYAILGQDAQGEFALCRSLMIALRPESPTAVDMDLFLLNETGSQIARSASSSPRETIDYQKNLSPQNVTIIVHFWAGAYAPFKLYVNATYATGLAAKLALYEDERN